jgi:integrase
VAPVEKKRANGEGSIQVVTGRAGYRAQVQLSNGRRPVKQCKSITEARRWIKQQQNLDENHQLDPIDDPTLDEWMNQWFVTRELTVARKTLANEKSHYARYFGPIRAQRLTKLTRGQIDDWLANVEHRGKLARPGVGQPHTVRLCYSLLSGALRDADAHELLRSNPIDRVQRPKTPPPRPKHIGRAAIDQMLRAVDASGDPRATAVQLMLRLGLRRNEALGLVWRDINFGDQTVTIQFQLGRSNDPQHPGKSILERRALKTSTSRRTLRLSSELINRLTYVKASTHGPVEPEHFVVSFRNGEPVDPDGMSHWLKRLSSEHDLVITPHMLRHTTATMMLNQGVPIETIGKVLGHADIRTTSVYARVLDDSSHAALEILAGELDRPATH